MPLIPSDKNCAYWTCSREDIFTEASGCLRSGAVDLPAEAKRRRLDEKEKAFPDFSAMMEYIQNKVMYGAK